PPVRSPPPSATDVRELPRGALVLSLFGVRPGVLDTESNPMADMLAAFGGAMLTNATAYDQVQRTASQLQGSGLTAVPTWTGPLMPVRSETALWASKVSRPLREPSRTSRRRPPAAASSGSVGCSRRSLAASACP